MAVFNAHSLFSVPLIGSSAGDPNAGTMCNLAVGTIQPATAGDKAFAGLLTGSCNLLLSYGGWMLIS